MSSSNMTNTLKSITIGLIVVLLVAIGAYFYPTQNVRVGAVSSSGAYANTVSWSSTVFAPLTGTSTSILNVGGSDRAILGTYVTCTGLGTSQTYTTGTGLASLTLQSATTSVSATGLQGNANYATNVTIATTSPSTNFYIATTTEGVLQYTSRIWPVNTYLTFNTNATSTATCSFGVEWEPL
jgi:hypothetical protein